MSQFRPERDPERPVYVISVAATLVSAHPRTLRIYEDEGLLCPARTPSNIRLYSENDIRRLTWIRHLTRDRGVNLAGIKLLFELEERLGARILEALYAEATEDEAADDSSTGVVGRLAMWVLLGLRLCGWFGGGGCVPVFRSFGIEGFEDPSAETLLEFEEEPDAGEVHAALPGQVADPREPTDVVLAVEPDVRGGPGRAEQALVLVYAECPRMRAHESRGHADDVDGTFGIAFWADGSHGKRCSRFDSKMGSPGSVRTPVWTSRTIEP